MRMWEPTADLRGLEGEVVDRKFRASNPGRTELLSGVVRMQDIIAEEGTYAGKTDDVYRALTDMSYVIAKWRGYLDTGNYKEAVDEYNGYVATYQVYIDRLKELGTRKNLITSKMLGFGS